MNALRSRRNRRNRLSDRAASWVREAIIAGKLQEGDRLYPEKLAEELDISVTPAREGLLAVEGEGFVEMVPRRGFVVSPLSSEDIRDIFISQALICGELASRAAQKMSDADVEELYAVQAELERAVGEDDYTAYAAANHQFHRMINVAANAPKMVWLLAITLRYTSPSLYTETSGWLEASCTDHHTILDALKQRDAEASRAAMVEHMTHLGDLLAARIAASEGRAGGGDGGDDRVRIPAGASVPATKPA